MFLCTFDAIVCGPHLLLTILLSISDPMCEYTHSFVVVVFFVVLTKKLHFVSKSAVKEGRANANKSDHPERHLEPALLGRAQVQPKLTQSYDE